MAILQHQIIQRPVADVTTLKALDVTLYADGEIIIVKAKGIYRYDPTSSATPDDDKVVQPSAGPGRWLRMTDANIDEHTESFTDLDDVDPVFYTVADAIVTNNSTPDGLVEGGGTLSSAGALKVVSAELSLGSVVNEISNDTTLEDKATAIVTEHVVKDVADNRQPLDADLTALAALSTDGVMARTGTATYATRTITGTLNQVNVNDGDGVSGNPILSTPQDIATTSSPTFANVTTPGLVDAGSLKGATGATVTEFSDDTTLADDSSTKSITQHAVKTYVDNTCVAFDGDQIYWVSGNGSDTLNNGKSENSPFATFGKALTEAGLLTPAAGNEIAVVCLEGGDFTEDATIDSYIHIYAPNVTINGQITVEGNASIVLKNLKYSGTGVALTRSGGGTDAGFAAAELISCTSTGDAIENATGRLELDIDRVEVNNGNGLQITGTSMTYTSGYINSIVCDSGGNCVDVSGLNVLGFGMSFGRLRSDNAAAISLTSNAKVNINAVEVSGNSAYVVNSSGAELNLSVTKLYGTETITSGTVNIVNPSGDSSFNGDIKAASFEGATGNAVTGFSDDVTMAADSTTLGVTQHAAKTYTDNIAAGIHWQKAVIDEVDFTTAEPGSPSVGDRYINTVTGTSSGTAQSVTEDYIYEWNGTDWTETVTEEGYACYVDDEDTYKVYNGTSWIDLNSVQTFTGLQDTYASYSTANAFVQNNATPDGLIESTITANGGAVSGFTGITFPTGGTITTTSGSITVSTGSGSNDDIDLIPDGTGVIKLGKDLDVNSKALSSVASINTVTWPAAGSTTGYVLTLTGPTAAAWQAAGGADLPDQVNVYYVGKNGNDSNDGLNLSVPKLTLTSANTAAGSTASKFYITDNGTYTSDSFITIADSVYDCRAATFSNSNIFLKAGASFSCHKFLVTSGDGMEHFSAADDDPAYFNANIISNSGSGRAIVHIGNDDNIQYYNIGLLLHSSSNSCVTHQLGSAYFDIDEVRTSGTATGNVFNCSGGLTTHTYVHIKKLDASGMNSSTPAFVVSGSTLYLEVDEVVGVSSTYDLFGISSTGVVYFNGKDITNALIDVSSGDVTYYRLDTAVLNFNPPKNLLVSGDFSKIPLWIKGVGLSSFSDGDPVTPSFLVLSSTTVDVQRNTSNENELVLQLTGTGYLGGYEPLYLDEFSTVLTDLKAAGETLSVGLYGRATGIISIKIDIIQWVPSTDDYCLQDPIDTWGSTPTLDSDATGTWSYVASSSNITISGSNSLMTWNDISLASFNTSATRLGLLIRTTGSESSGDALIIKKLAMHRGYKFMGFEDRDEITKTETRIACTYNNNIVIGTTGQMSSAIYSCFGYEVEPDVMHIAHFNYNTTLIDIPVAADANSYNPQTGTAGQVRELDGTNGTIETIDSISQHSISIREEPDDGWTYNFKMHVVVHPKPYQ